MDEGECHEDNKSIFPGVTSVKSIAQFLHIQQHSKLVMNDTPVAAMHTLWIQVESEMPWQIPFSSDDVSGLISESMSDWRLGPRLDGIAGCRLMLNTAEGIELRKHKTFVTLLREHPTAGSTPSNSLILRIL